MRKQVWIHISARDFCFWLSEKLLFGLFCDKPTIYASRSTIPYFYLGSYIPFSTHLTPEYAISIIPAHVLTEAGSELSLQSRLQRTVAVTKGNRSGLSSLLILSSGLGQSPEDCTEVAVLPSWDKIILRCGSMAIDHYVR